MEKMIVFLVTVSSSLTVFAGAQTIHCEADQMSIKNHIVVENKSEKKEATFAFPEGKEFVRGTLQLVDSEITIATKREGSVWFTIKQGDSSRTIIGSFAKDMSPPRFIWAVNDSQGDTFVYQRVQCDLLPDAVNGPR